MVSHTLSLAVLAYYGERTMSWRNVDFVRFRLRRRGVVGKAVCLQCTGRGIETQFWGFYEDSVLLLYYQIIKGPIVVKTPRVENPTYRAL